MFCKILFSRRKQREDELKQQDSESQPKKRKRASNGVRKKEPIVAATALEAMEKVIAVSRVLCSFFLVGCLTAQFLPFFSKGVLVFLQFLSFRRLMFSYLSRLMVTLF